MLQYCNRKFCCYLIRKTYAVRLIIQAPSVVNGGFIIRRLASLGDADEYFVKVYYGETYRK